MKLKEQLALNYAKNYNQFLDHENDLIRRESWLSGFEAAKQLLRLDGQMFISIQEIKELGEEELNET